MSWTNLGNVRLSVDQNQVYYQTTPDDSVFASLAEWQLLATGVGFIRSGFVRSGLSSGVSGVNLQWQISVMTLSLAGLGHILGLKVYVWPPKAQRR